MFDLYEYSIEKINELCVGPKTKYSDRFWFRCPFCGDSKKNKGKRRGWLYKDIKTGVSYHCFNCGITYVGYRFLMELENKSYKEIKKDLFREYKDLGFDKAVKDILIPNKNKKSNTEPQPHKEEKTFDLLSHWEPIKNFDHVNKIITDRFIYQAPNLPKNFKLYYDTKHNKIIIPWYRDNKMRYYQYRRIISKDGPKYLFPARTEKDIFGLDNINPNFPFIFFFEGAFDSIWVKNGIAVGGAMITEHQKQILKKFQLTHTLVYFPDNPYIDTRARDEIIKLSKKDSTFKIFKWNTKNKYKDINEEIINTQSFNKYMNENFLKKSIIDIKKYNILLKFLR